MKALLMVVIILLQINPVRSQTGSINNTLGTGGSFNIKDGSTTFLSLNQANGLLLLNNNLSIPYTTSSSIGVIFKGNDPFIHNYQAPGTSGNNTFIGINSGNFFMSGSINFQASNNTAAGKYTLSSLTTGYSNSAFGFQSLMNNTTGSYNSAFGIGSLILNTSGTDNSSFGGSALTFNTTGSNNSGFGTYSLYYNTTGSDNSAFGDQSLYSNATGDDNSSFGFKSLYSNTTGYVNSAFGNYSLLSNTIGVENSSFGYYTLGDNTAGGENSAFGAYALIHNSTGSFNCAFGDRSLLENLTGQYNSAFGESSLHNNTTAKFNSAFGNGALYNNTTGWYNSAFGNQALVSNSTGTQNTAVGHNSLFSNTSGFQNTAVGDSALYYNTGNYNTAIGYNAGSNVTSGHNLTLVGIDANPSSGTAFDEITLGNIYVGTLRCNATTITSLSDARDKTNIKDLPLGLDFLMTLKPRLYHWDRREWYKDGKPDGSKMQQSPTAGFIAQELDTAQIKANAEWLNLVLKSNPERLEATPGNLLPVIVKAIQELKTEKDDEIAKLSERIQNLENEIIELKSNENKVQISNNN